jgi:chromosomal replication initiator protein
LIVRLAREAWETALGRLQVEVTRHNYETWLKDTVGLEYSGDVFTVGVPSAFVAECLEKRMTPIIHKTLKALLQREVTVTYRVMHAGSAVAEDDDLSLRPPATAIPVRERPRQQGNGLNPRYTFESFVVGKSNRFAHAAAVAVAENPGHSYNPLVIHSGVGLGKTHLLHAIAHHVKAKGLQYLYVSAEQFTNDFVSALREARVEEFREKYRNIDVLLIDDIQFIAGKEHSRETFFHTFNDLHLASKQIVISSDALPRSLPLLEDRFLSRLEGGLRAEILPPDLETRMAILTKKAQQMGLAVPPDVVDFIARKVPRNIREMEGAFNRLLAMAQLTSQPLTLDLAAQAIADLPTTAKRPANANPQEIVAATAAYFGLTPDDLRAKTRKKNIAHARQVAAYLLREDTSRSLSEIGQLLGERGHSTVLRAHDKIAYELNLDAELRKEIGEVRDSLDRRRSQSA